MGSNFVYYATQSIFAIKNNYYIFFVRHHIKYYDSIYVKCLLDYLEHYNKKINSFTNLRVMTMETGNLCYAYSKPVIDFKSDVVSLFQETFNDDYFMKYFGGTFHQYFLKECREKKNYNLPFDPSKVIIVHVRLDDLGHLKDCDCKTCADDYRELINSDKLCYWDEKGPPNYQAPLDPIKIQNEIDKMLAKYPDREVIIVTSPISNPELPYKCIKSSDIDYDLFLLTCAEVLIMSRSNYVFMALLFGNHKDVAMPLWGHTVAAGYDTKYDKKRYNYFY
jgi:hypothetical protein